MENEIKKVIAKWNREYQECETNTVSPRIMFEFAEDLESLLKFKQEKCCGKVGENETNKDKTE